MTFTMTAPTLEHKGVKYELELGKAERSELGYEDHGIFAVNVQFNLGGSVQGLGHRCLTDGLAYRAIKDLLRVFQVRVWEDIRGRELYLLRDADEGRFGLIRGLLSKDQKEILVFEDWFDERG
jgi:hypothetical protein